MLEGQRILIVVPARGGSKGLPRKNLQPLLGVPLVARVGLLLKELAYVDRAVVSTDDEEIARVAREAGIDAPFRRPEDLSGDTISDAAVLRHALEEMERLDARRYDIIVMLQPTSPLRRAAHVTATVEKLLRGRWDAVWTVSQTDVKYHPLKQLTLGEAGRLGYYDEQGAQIIARQQLTPVYHRNGCAYAMTRACLVDDEAVMGRRTGAVLIDEPMVSIDTLEDLKAAQRLLEARAHRSASTGAAQPSGCRPAAMVPS